MNVGADEGATAAAGAAIPGFGEEFMRKLEYLSLVSKRFSGQLKAERRDRKLGSGIEFRDYRGYVPGDDFRYLDWKTYLRLDRLLLRLYEEEQDLPIYLFLDTSGSMAYGHPSKLEYSRRIAAALAYIGLANLDRVTLISYSGGIQKQLAPQRGKHQIFRVFRFLAQTAASGETSSREAFKMFCTGSRRRGLAVVISDFLESGGFEEGLDMLRYYKHDVFAVHVVAQEDLEPPVHGELRIVDSETGQERELTVTPDVLQAYSREMQTFSDRIQRHCLRYQLGYLRTVTDFPFEDLVLEVFRQGRFLK